MPVEEAPEDDEVRETYNFAPGYHGLIYRADTSDTGARRGEEANAQDDEQPREGGLELPTSKGMESGIKYKLQAMKWGSSNRSAHGFQRGSLSRLGAILDET